MLHTLTVHEAHSGLRDKKFSSVELTKACLKQIDAKDGAISAFVKVTEEWAMRCAHEADAARNESSGPLHGIPCALKDVFCTKDIRTTACSNILKSFVPPYDAVTVQKLKATGMVMVGKTNTDEFTCGGSTETSCFGPTKTPWDVARVAGGSSGGSAAAVSADMCMYALGTDTGGSIRQPASFCSVTGLKVTYGRVSRSGVISMASSLDTVGPLAKDVMDIALIMNVIAGRDPSDSTMPDVPIPDYTESLKDHDISGLRIGIPDEYFTEGIDADVEKCVRDAVKALEKKGATVKGISLPHTKYAVAVYYIVSPSEVSANMARYDGIRYGPGLNRDVATLEEYYTGVRGAGFGDEMKRRIIVGTYALSAGYYDAYYLKAQKVRTLVLKDFQDAFREVDVICAPVAPTPPFKIGENTDNPVKMYLADAFTIPASLAGLPALSVPCGFSSKNLPIGLQIVGPQFGEPLVLRVGHVYQTLTDWHKKKPAL